MSHNINSISGRLSISTMVRDDAGDQRNYLPFRYLLATLRANDDRTINPVINRRRANNKFRLEPVPFLPGKVSTTKMPITPKTIDEYMKTLVARFCIVTVYQNSC